MKLRFAVAVVAAAVVCDRARAGARRRSTEGDRPRDGVSRFGDCRPRVARYARRPPRPHAVCRSRLDRRDRPRHAVRARRRGGTRRVPRRARLRSRGPLAGVRARGRTQRADRCGRRRRRAGSAPRRPVHDRRRARRHAGRRSALRGRPRPNRARPRVPACGALRYRTRRRLALGRGLRCRSRHGHDLSPGRHHARSVRRDRHPRPQRRRRPCGGGHVRGSDERRVGGRRHGLRRRVRRVDPPHRARRHRLHARGSRRRGVRRRRRPCRCGPALPSPRRRRWSRTAPCTSRTRRTAGSAGSTR